ncbi:MAG: acyl-ACP--UDP-N-acetylglucosamine O-acyltransferase [Myxococcales bacterium]|nr:acyl-ACP--UDP-N-acetylglucosamine O-acyltransferase [Myxococcales bacterium]
MNAQVDPTAWVDPSARLGHGVVVGAHARVGPRCVLHPYAIVGDHTELGSDCQVHPFAVVGGPAQDRQTDPNAPHRLICGPANVFREGVTINRGTAHGGSLTRLGARGLYMTQVHVGHDCQVGDDVVLANGVSLAGHVTVEAQASLGGHAAVHQFARIGRLAFVAANAMISRDVPPFCLAAGDRATLRGLNTVGLQRAGLPPETRAALKRAYRALFRTPGGRRGADELARHPIPEVAALARFVTESARGVTGARGG